MLDLQMVQRHLSQGPRDVQRHLVQRPQDECPSIHQKEMWMRCEEEMRETAKRMNE